MNNSVSYSISQMKEINFTGDLITSQEVPIVKKSLYCSFTFPDTYKFKIINNITELKTKILSA